jgi:hypothetical protein
MKLYMFRTEELSETYRASCPNKFVKLVHLVGFITKKFVTMHGHMNVKLRCFFYDRYRDMKFSKGVNVTLLSKRQFVTILLLGKGLTCTNIYYYLRYYFSPGQGKIEVNLSLCPSMETRVSRNVCWKMSYNICDNSFVTIWFSKARPTFWYKRTK